jgi:proline dehydrogenase
MGLTRTLLLRASRSQWLASQFRNREFARRAVRRFMPGDQLSDALDACAEFAAAGMGTVLTELGEQTRSGVEAQAVRDHYLDVFSQLRERFLPTQLSVKLTHLGLDLSREACTRHVLQLAAKAEEEGSFLWIDMEESRYVDATLDIYRRARADRTNIGVCLQAYLRRTPTDLADLLPLSPAIRLVKGAYREPPDVALPRKKAVDEQYLALADQLLAATGAGRAHAVFGTHDLKLIAHIREQAAKRKATGRYEIHMLYGIRAADQLSLVAEGLKVRALVSYGSHWFAWYMRRLAERPANMWFVLRSLF